MSLRTTPEEVARAIYSVGGFVARVPVDARLARARETRRKEGPPILSTGLATADFLKRDKSAGIRAIPPTGSRSVASGPIHDLGDPVQVPGPRQPHFRRGPSPSAAPSQDKPPPRSHTPQLLATDGLFIEADRQAGPMHSGLLGGAGGWGGGLGQMGRRLVPRSPRKSRAAAAVKSASIVALTTAASSPRRPLLGPSAARPRPV
jgi:hypothetical protein